MVEFEEIQEVGSKVRNILYEDTDQIDWINNLSETYIETGEYPEGLIEDIIEYLQGYDDEETKNIIHKIKYILNQDGPDNLANSILCDDEDDGATDDTIDQPTLSNQIISFMDEEDETQYDESNPEHYFNKQINKVQEVLKISHDLAYLLNKKYGPLLISKWVQSNEILKSLRIKIGSENVPSLESPLSFREIGIGECPICSSECELIQLYCGHVTCKDCLLDEINYQLESLKPIFCRHYCKEDDSPCNAEILPNDVYKLLEGSPEKLIQRYTTALIRDQIDHDDNIRQCPSCDAIITRSHMISENFARCPRCCAVTCLRCKLGFHGPLTCSRKIDFFETQREKMHQLEEDQESWYFREKRLQAYRRENKQPVFKYFDDLINQVQKKNDKAEYMEKQKVKETQFYIDKLQKDLNSLSIQFRNLESGSNIEKLCETRDKIEEVKKELTNKQRFLEILKSDFEKNAKERQKDLFDADTEKEYFINAISNESKFDFFLDQYKNLVNDEAYKSLNVAVTDEEAIKRSTKLCPKCGTPIEKSYGCNWMKCICHFEFCYFCNQPWYPTHSDHHKCPKYDMIKDSRGNSKSECGIDFTDMKDMKFYPPPMTPDTRKMFIRYNNLRMQYMKTKESYDKLTIELLKTDSNDNIKDLPYDRLQPRDRLIKALMVEKSLSAISLANQIINTALFGKAVVMNGFPQMFYIMLKQDNANLFEYNLYKLDNQVDELIELIRKPGSSTYSDFEKCKIGIELQSKIILEDGERF